MINTKNVDITKDFQNFPIEAPVESESITEEVNRACDKLITELSGIKLRILAIQGMTKFCGPAIDAEMFCEKTIKYLKSQKR